MGAQCYLDVLAKGSFRNVEIKIWKRLTPCHCPNSTVHYAASTPPDVELRNGAEQVVGNDVRELDQLYSLALCTASNMTNAISS